MPWHCLPILQFPKAISSGTIFYFSKEELWKIKMYDVQNYVGFCHLCIKSLQVKKMTTKRADPSFVKRGFSYWKDTTIAFKKHESSDCHKEAVHVSPQAYPDIGEMLHQNMHNKRNRTDIAFLK